MILIDPEYTLGDRVYLSTDPDQHERIVTAIMVSMGGSTTYRLACGTAETWHYAAEMTKERDIVKATSE